MYEKLPNDQFNTIINKLGHNFHTSKVKYAIMEKKGGKSTFDTFIQTSQVISDKTPTLKTTASS